ncbi:MAG TPA: hypothetical protein VHB20_15795 [Verrucomicrobiae bacterium]|jgi:hypothetical protein|nr:hypothetical protein [Verrucomicrobiae bacterium]
MNRPQTSVLSGAFFRNFSRTLGMLAALTAASGAQASPGGADYTFTQQGVINGPIYAATVDFQGNIFIGGDFTSVYNQDAPSLAVLNTNGALKNIPSLIGVQLNVHALALDGGGRVYAGGKNSVVRLINNGGGWVLDSSFGNQGYVSASYVTSLAVRGQDAFWVAGQYGLTQYDISGNQNTGFSVDSRFSGYIAQVRYVAPAAGGNATFGEHLDLAGGFGVGSVLANGSHASGPFLGYRAASCVAERDGGAQLDCLSGHGELVGAGDLETIYAYNYFYPTGNGLWMQRFGGVDSSAYFHGISSDTNYPADQGGGVAAMEALEGGDLLVTGDVQRIGGVNVNNLAHLLPNGTVDQNFQNSLGFYGTAIARQPDGKFIIVGYGNYTPLTGQISRRLAIPPVSGVSFSPPPANVTVYEGDGFCLSSGVVAWPTPQLEWAKGNSPIPNENYSSLCVDGATSADAGDYTLQATTFCGPESYKSPAAHVTVLPAPAPPVNDSFSSAVTLNNGVSVHAQGTIRSATMEADESDPSGNADGRSVWWTWTAPETGGVTIDLSGSDYEVSAAVYQGSDLASLDAVGNNCDFHCYSNGEGGQYCNCLGLLKQLSFIATQGVTYSIQIGGSPAAGSLGDIDFTLKESSLLAGATAWKTAASPTNIWWHAAASVPGQLVIVGENAGILFSSDAVHWSVALSGLDSSLTLAAVTHGKGLFVASGDQGSIATSPDGATWSAQVSGASDVTLKGVAFGAGKFLAVGEQGYVLTSGDGTNWTTQATNAGAYSYDTLYAATYAQGLFVAVGDDASVITSPDGTNWTVQSTPAYNSLYSVAYGNGLFVAVGGDGLILNSTNAVDWDEATTPISANLNAVAYGNGHFVAGSESGDILVSADGLSWQNDVSPASAPILGAASLDAGRFLLVGGSGEILVNQLPELAGITLLPDNTIQFGLIGLTGSTAIIDASATLSPPAWVPIATNLIVNGTITFIDTNSTVSRYYRARVQ